MRTSDLIKRLTTADRAWRRTGALEKLLRAFKVVCVVAVVMVAADLIMQLGSLTRLGMTAVAGITLLGFLAVLWRRAFAREHFPDADRPAS